MKYVPTSIDVFSGCGGMTTGLKQAGFRVLAGVEINEQANITYRLNHPAVRLFDGDIRNLKGSDMLNKIGIGIGELDLLAGCPPCQGFSRMRTRNRNGHVYDVRNDLILEFLRLVREMLPKSILLENVPGLASDSRFALTVSELEKLGYTSDYAVVNAADYGVPQRRHRLILVGSRLGPVAVTHGKSVHRTVRQAIGNLSVPGKSRNPLHRLLATRSDSVMDRIKRIPKNGGSRSALGDEQQLECHKRLGGFYDVYGRMSWDAVAPTITRSCSNPSKGRFLHPDQDREISPFEAAILQSFPRAYRFPLQAGREAICSMIGEALPPLLVKKQARVLLEHIESFR